MTMNTSLEFIERPPEGSARATPLLFVHGAYADAWCWDYSYLPWFAQQGWQASAFSFSGHGKSPGSERLNAFSIADYVRDLASVIAGMPAKPVVIAHSMGGLVLQKYLEEAELPGAVLLCSVPPQGLLGATMNLMLNRPNVLFELSRIIGGSAPELETLREALFHQPVTQAMLQECFKHFQPESMRAVWDMSGFDLPSPSRMRRPPMLILGAEHDALIPPGQVEQTGESLSQQVCILPDMGHAIMLEQGWEAGAGKIAEWLLAQGF